MYLAVKDVKALEDYQLLLKFENDEERVFDVKPYLEIGKLQELKDENLFKTVKVSTPLISFTSFLAPWISSSRFILIWSIS